MCQGPTYHQYNLNQYQPIAGFFYIYGDTLMKNLLNKLFNTNDTSICYEVTDWLVQEIKSRARKCRPYNITVATLRHTIANEFMGTHVTPKMFIKVLSLTKRELFASGIEMVADDKNIVACRPISCEMLEA